MGKARGRNKIESRVVDMTAGDAPGTLPGLAEECPPEERDEETFSIELDEQNRIITRMCSWRNRVVEFAVTQQHQHKGQWVDVVRADTCHDEVHIHRFGRKGDEFNRQPLRSIQRIEDVETGYDEVVDSIHDQWDENLRRWRNGR